MHQGRIIRAVMFSFIPVFFLHLICLQGCSGRDSLSKDAKGTGSATFNIKWPDTVLMQHNNLPSQSSAVTNIDCTAMGITKVHAMFMIANTSNYPQGNWSCSDHQGTVHNIPEGSGYEVWVGAYDTYDNVLFSGTSCCTQIIAGQTTNVGTITLEETVFGNPGPRITSPEEVLTWRNGHYAARDQTINAGSVLNFQGEVEGGKKPYSLYSWNFSGGATNSSIQNPGNVTFNIPGSYPVIFKVIDANGNTGSTYRVFIVSATQSSSTPGLSAVIILPEGNQTITAGQSVFFLGSVIGGTAPYTYKWSSGTETLGSSQYPEDVMFNTSGVYTVMLQVTDANGATSSDSVEINVLSQQSP